MKQTFVEEMKTILGQTQNRLRQELDLVKAESGKKTDKATWPEYGDKDDENAAEVATFSDKLSLNRALEETLEDVESALRRITDGSYGVCKYCQTKIDERRLRARPESSSCVDCKTKLLNKL
ncbi:TraR/DksA C4-type zinc finger protein [Patescibacteria group bacterium]|nr:TraR/DksA C4-type zinc finger protein [Patescibacteria group bacterium]